LRWTFAEIMKLEDCTAARVETCRSWVACVMITSARYESVVPRFETYDMSI